MLRHLRRVGLCRTAVRMRRAGVLRPRRRAENVTCLSKVPRTTPNKAQSLRTPILQMEAQRLNDLLRSEELELGFKPNWLIQNLWPVKNQAHVIRLLKGHVTAQGRRKGPGRSRFPLGLGLEGSWRVRQAGWGSQDGRVSGQSSSKALSILWGRGRGGICGFHPVVAL